ncbi:MAG: protease modulator HflC, partial [Candidatus Eiseniibacteriota bacterium]
KIRAEADRERTEILAAAESEAERLRGDGEAEAARIYADAYRGHEDFYRFLRTLESYEKVLGERTTLVLPADSPFLDVLMSRLPASSRSRRPEAVE